MNLKRLNATAVNAIGLAAELNGRTLAWLFNTDGSDNPIEESNLWDTKVEMFSWHGFGDVVTPSFWRIMFSMDEDKLMLDCGMRKEVGCPLVECEGLVQNLLAHLRKCKIDCTNTRDIRCYLVLLLQDTKATVIDICDW